jgi:hypothetical protein
MRNYEIRTGEGLNPKNMGDTSGSAKRYYVWDADSNVRMTGFTAATCRDGGFKTKKAANEFIALLTGQK